MNNNNNNNYLTEGNLTKNEKKITLNKILTKILIFSKTIQLLKNKNAASMKIF